MCVESSVSMLLRGAGGGASSILPRAALQSKWTLQLYIGLMYEGCAGTAVTPHCRVSETERLTSKPDAREMRET